MFGVLSVFILISPGCTNCRPCERKLRQPLGTAWCYAKSTSDWAVAVAFWQTNCSLSVSHMNMNPDCEFIDNCESVAQSFLPAKTNIAAVEIGVYPLGVGREWYRADIREDQEGLPSGKILTWAWVEITSKAPISCGIIPYGFLLFDVPDIPVATNKIYWLVYTAVRVPSDLNIARSPVRFSGTNTYADGVVLAKGPFSDSFYSRDDDMYFRIWAQTPPVPQMRKAKVWKRLWATHHVLSENFWLLKAHTPVEPSLKSDHPLN